MTKQPSASSATVRTLNLKTGASRSGSSSSPGPNAGRIVLCATDFSVHAAQAARVGALLACKLKARLHLVHVIDTSVLPQAASGALKEWLRQVRKQLDTEVERLQSVPAVAGLEMTTEIMEGRPEGELVRYAERHQPWCIVMASIGQVAISRVLAGSVAERTAESALVPTLIVREDGVMRDWLEGRAPLKVFVAADFSATSEAALLWVKGLRQVGPCELTVGLMDWPPEAERRYGIHGGQGGVGNRTRLQAMLERDLRERVQTLTGDTSARIRVEAGWGAPEFNLMQMATEDHMGLFVVGTHQRHGLSRLFQPSVSRAVIHHAPMNVACVPGRGVMGAESVAEVRRVLVTTDLSPMANAALAHGCSILPSGGVVRLLHVMPPWGATKPVYDLMEPGKWTPKAHGNLKERLLKQMGELVPEGLADRGIRVETVILEGGAVAKMVAQEAERMGADVICISSHGRTGLLSLALGSVAQQVIAESRKPVLVVKSGSRA